MSIIYYILFVVLFPLKTEAIMCKSLFALQTKGPDDLVSYVLNPWGARARKVKVDCHLGIQRQSWIESKSLPAMMMCFLQSALGCFLQPPSFAMARFARFRFQRTSYIRYAIYSTSVVGCWRLHRQRQQHARRTEKHGPKTLFSFTM